ncbi:MAG: hypothetical protein U1F63_01780 [Chitinivorax sp.]
MKKQLLALSICAILTMDKHFFAGAAEKMALIYGSAGALLWAGSGIINALVCSPNYLLFACACSVFALHWYFAEWKHYQILACSKRAKPIGLLSPSALVLQAAIGFVLSYHS